jgi:tRNA G18 (ribose-2'-O)-methylase SpoU
MNQKLSMTSLGRMSAGEFRESEKQPVILVLENIRSGLNVGSIFRSADAFRIEKIWCCGYTPVPPHREVLKSALGATESVAWEYAENTMELIHKLREQGIVCVAAEQTEHSTDLHAFLPEQDKKTALVLGNEVQGVTQEVINACDLTLEVSQHGTKHSLNVAVCAGIILYDLTSKYTARKK